MANKWLTKCIDCNDNIGYSDAIYQKDATLGLSHPIRCSDCERKLSREYKALAVRTQKLKSLGKKHIKKSPLGNLEVTHSQHSLTNVEPGFSKEKHEEMFGVKPEQLKELYQLLLQPNIPVVVAVAPTGSGKSTYLPYRLLQPLMDDGISENAFTRFGQIVITQPRKAPTSEIPIFVSEGIYGQECGVGWDIGFRHSGVYMCDWRCKMAYVTDGTLINWLTTGQVEKIGIIMIDEAHERSLNIDIILGLLAKIIPQTPHLKVIIASATIDEDKFRKFFTNSLPGDLECRIIKFDGKTHENAGYERFFRPEDSPIINYETSKKGNPASDGMHQIPKELDENISKLLADEVMLILKHIFKVDGHNGIAPNGDNVLKGDIVGFLHGAAAIDEAIAAIQDQVKVYPEIDEILDVIPLHSKVDTQIRDKAIKDKEDPDRIRVIISSNMAETSLTIDGIVHVVDSGLIKQTRWDPVTEKESLISITHSRAGCRQRWGRAGRKEPGQVWCLYTEKQFEDNALFRQDSVPEIQRAPLDQIVLGAKMAGGDTLSNGKFPWLDAPKDIEFERAIKRLKAQHALDDEDDLTLTGLEMRHGGGDLTFQRLVTIGDSFGCAIEMVTVIALIEVGLNRLCLYDKNFDKKTTSSIDNAMFELKQGCNDDLEFCLKLYASWKHAQEGGSLIVNNLYWKSNWIEKKHVIHDKHIKNLLSPEDYDQLRKILRKIFENAKTQTELKRLRHEWTSRYKQNHKICESLSRLFDSKISEFKEEAAKTWVNMHYLDEESFNDANEKREKLIDNLGVAKKERERRDIDFRSIARLRILFAWVLRDQRYVLKKEINDSSNKTSEMSTANEEDRNWKDVTFERHHPEKFDDELLIRVSKYSTKHGSSLEAFVTCGPKFKNPNNNELYVLFVVETTEQILNTISTIKDETELACYMARNCPRPIKQITDHNLAIRLLINQIYPRFSRARCRIVSKSQESDFCYNVEVVESLGMVETKISPLFLKKDKRSLNSNLIDKEDSEFVQKYKSRKQTKKSYNVDEKEFEETNIISDAEEMEIGNSITENLEPNVLAGNTQQKINNIEALLNDITFNGWLYTFAPDETYQIDDEIDVEISAHRLIGKTAQEVGIIVNTSSIASRFEMFYETYKIGDTVSLFCINDERTSLSQSDVAMVFEKKTCAECIISSSEFFPGVNTSIFSSCNTTHTLQAKVLQIDYDTKEIEVTLLPLLDNIYDNLSNKDRSTHYPCQVLAKNRKEMVLLLSHVYEEGIVLVTAKPNDASPIPDSWRWEIGSQLNTIIEFKHKSFENVFMDRLSVDFATIKTLCENHGLNIVETSIVDGKPIGKITLEGRMTYNQRNELLLACNCEHFWYKIKKLYSRSNQIYSTPVLDNLIKMFPVGGKINGTLVAIIGGKELHAKVKLQNNIYGAVLPSEVTWYENRPNMGEYLDDKKGTQMSFIVTEVDQKKQIVYLSIRRCSENPWNNKIPTKYPKNSVVSGIVQKQIDDGFLVKIEPKLKGLVHKSDVPEKGLQEGEEITVQINHVNSRDRKISLLITNHKEDLWIKYIPTHYAVGKVIKGRVRNINERFGAFVDLERGIDGLIHISKLSNDHVTNVRDIVQESQNVYVKVISLDKKKREIGLQLIEVY